MAEKSPRPIGIDEREGKRRLEEYERERARLDQEHREALAHIQELEREVLAAQPQLRSPEAVEKDRELQLLRRQFEAFKKKYPLGEALGDMQELLLFEMAELTYRALEKNQENVWEHPFLKEILLHANKGYLSLVANRTKQELTGRVAKALKGLGISY